MTRGGGGVKQGRAQKRVGGLLVVGAVVLAVWYVVVVDGYDTPPENFAEVFNET